MGTTSIYLDWRFPWQWVGTGLSRRDLQSELGTSLFLFYQKSSLEVYSKRKIIRKVYGSEYRQDRVYSSQDKEHDKFGIKNTKKRGQLSSWEIV